MKLSMPVYEKAVILPWRVDPKGSTGLGGVVDVDGDFIESSYCHGGKYEHGGIYEYDKSIIKHSTENVIYFGYFLPHWGHFLIDCLGRMWPFLQSDERLKDYKIAFISQVGEFYSNCYEFFENLGIEKKRIIHVGEPTQFDKVAIPNIDYTPEPNRQFATQYLQVFNKVVNEILQKHSLCEVTEKYGNIRKVYFTRSRFRGARSREVGLQVIDKVFEKGGYNVIAPERLSLSEQVLIWNYAERIACINGTIPLNVIFKADSFDTCRGGKLLILTVLNKMQHEHTNLIEYLELRKEVKAEFIDIRDTRIRDLSIGDGRGLGPFRMGITTELLEWMQRNGIPTDKSLYKENLLVKRMRYYFLFIINSPRPWLAQHMPEALRKYARKVLRT